jgi:hypothetical protein
MSASIADELNQPLGAIVANSNAWLALACKGAPQVLPTSAINGEAFAASAHGR